MNFTAHIGLRSIHIINSALLGGGFWNAVVFLQDRQHAERDGKSMVELSNVFINHLN